MVKFVLLILLIISGGCSLTNEDEYRNSLIEIQEAINSEDFSKALNLLNKMPVNDETAKLTAISYGGRAGFNALKIADLIYQKEGAPVVALLYEMADKFYKPEALEDLNKAINYIKVVYELKPKSQDVNAIYGLLQVYKSAQIILKAVKTQKVNTCDVIEFATEDIFELTLSLNSAALSLENYVKSIRDFTNKLREDLELPETEESAEEILNNFKNNLQKAIYEQVQNCGSIAPI